MLPICYHDTVLIWQSSWWLRVDLCLLNPPMPFKDGSCIGHHQRKHIWREISLGTDYFPPLSWLLVTTCKICVLALAHNTLRKLSCMCLWISGASGRSKFYFNSSGRKSPNPITTKLLVRMLIEALKSLSYCISINSLVAAGNEIIAVL